MNLIRIPLGNLLLPSCYWLKVVVVIFVFLFIHHLHCAIKCFPFFFCLIIVISKCQWTHESQWPTLQRQHKLLFYLVFNFFFFLVCFVSKWTLRLNSLAGGANHSVNCSIFCFGFLHYLSLQINVIYIIISIHVHSIWIVYKLYEYFFFSHYLRCCCCCYLFEFSIHLSNALKQLKNKWKKAWYLWIEN